MRGRGFVKMRGRLTKRLRCGCCVAKNERKIVAMKKPQGSVNLRASLYFNAS